MTAAVVYVIDFMRDVLLSTLDLTDFPSLFIGRVLFLPLPK